jgi:hypothetical protein
MTTRTLLALGLCVVAAPLTAQRQSRSGLWLESGGGTGTIRVGCATCAEPISLYGESAYLRIGGTLSRKVLLGLEIFTLTDRTFRLSDGDSTIVVENAVIAPVVLWYPWAGGTFVKMGVGFARSDIAAPLLEGSPAIISNGIGSGVTFGAGFDIPLRKWLALTVNVGVYYSALGDVIVNANPVDDVITTMYNANFAITIR